MLTVAYIYIYISYFILINKIYLVIKLNIHTQVPNINIIVLLIQYGNVGIFKRIIDISYKHNEQ